MFAASGYRKRSVYYTIAQKDVDDVSMKMPEDPDGHFGEALP